MPAVEVACVVDEATVGFLFVRRLIHGAEVEGVFTLFAILFTLLGVAMAGLGIVGEYVARIYLELKGRHQVVIRKVHG